MKLQVEWMRPIMLRDGTHQNLIYTVNLDRLPDNTAGIYVLGRRFGSHFEALYVGKASRIRGRLKDQLNNLRLMQHLRKAKTGRRIALIGRVVTRPGQRLDKCLALIERALIRYFLSEGHDLVNKQGTRLRRHEIVASGNHPKRFIPSPIYLEKAGGE